MSKVEFIKDLDRFKVLTDHRRRAILRIVMSEPATLTQIGEKINKHPAWVRHHLKQLEQAGMVKMSAVKVKGGVVEKYYRAEATAFIFHDRVLPVTSDGDDLVVMGSHDYALDLLRRSVKRSGSGTNLLTLAVGSMDGLMALRQDFTHITCCHLFDAQSGEYNLPFVRHFFPGKVVHLVTLAQREQGLLVNPGNPKNIHSLEDVFRDNIIFINRNEGSGTRLWVDVKMKEEGLALEEIHSYEGDAQTHTQVAQTIQQGKADAGIALRAAAKKFELDFVPLFQERFDLVIPDGLYKDEKIVTLLEHLHSGGFRGEIETLEGYETHQTGNEIVV